MTFYIPQYKAFCGAEVVSTPCTTSTPARGAKVRDALEVEGYIDEAITPPGQDAEVYFGSHHWPVWGKERINSFLKSQRDTYKFIHDQTLRLANAGYTPKEIRRTQAALHAGEELLPTATTTAPSATTPKRFIRPISAGMTATRPTSIHCRPPKQAPLYVEAIGGADKVLGIAQQSYDKGQYRWTAELLNHLVFAQPDNPGGP